MTTVKEAFDSGCQDARERFGLEKIAVPIFMTMPGKKAGNPSNTRGTRTRTRRPPATPAGGPATTTSAAGAPTAPGSGGFFSSAWNHANNFLGTPVGGMIGGGLAMTGIGIGAQKLFGDNN
jgi:hypothetical protein